ncbi:hypothetical protein DMB92_00485 [Campylobacter sp. MIT 99-7217]|uniref:ABC transporter substrate-binding protein n=1 Tax=Campylobacter sp. MIT 99-7217 TaxID=535091 RepID=UPI00115AC0D9|nr:ABC transporter substrate-binding protein [Campylobacter sp. MIT 99-7217]TQR34476.1 hypothetical protein DMB92_00485 [Campylobacter sp. MIT 99-7217]
MRIFLFKICKNLIFLAFLFDILQADIKEEPKFKVFGMSPQITVLLQILYPQGLVGLNYTPRPEDKEFMPENVAKLPVLGGTRNTEVSFEKLVALKPDFIFVAKNTPKHLITAYEKHGIKIIELEIWDRQKLPQSISIIGKNLHIEQRASKLNAFLEKSQNLLLNLENKILKRPSIYFAFGNDGLQTSCLDPKNEKEDLAFKIGGKNAITCSLLSSKQGLSSVNFEILLKLDPDLIFVREKRLYQELLNKPSKSWQNLSAIQNKKIYYAPSSPSNWLYRPPSILQSIGIPWAFSKVQPELLSENLAKELAQEFFKLFFQELSDEQYKALFLKN